MTIFKKCGCGREYTEAEWKALPLHSIQSAGEEDGFRFSFEQKDCACGNTMCGPEMKEAI